MATLNQVSLIGYVGDDPNVTQTKSNEYLASMRIATTERGFTKKDGSKVEDRTEWHNVVFFGSIAEKLIAPYVRKGCCVFIQGKMRTRAYEKDGIKRYVTEVVGDNIQLLDKKNPQTMTTSSGPGSMPPPGTPVFGKGGIFENNDTADDDIPF